MNRTGHVLVVLIIIIGCFAPIFLFVPTPATAYTPHDPISINGDADFAEQAASEGWPGDGTEGNPYVIEGYEIDTTYENGIEIKSTAVHFIIRQIITLSHYYHSDYGGIYLDNVSNGSIESCVLEKNYYGIYINSSSGINITDNEIIDNLVNGLYLENSSVNTITENKINENYGSGIYLDFSDENIISGNNISYNSGHSFIFDISYSGILVHYSIQNTITGNVMYGNGIFIEGDTLEHWISNNIDSTNTVWDKPVYFWKNQTNGAVPSDAGQVIIANCSNIIIEDQEIYLSTYGIAIAYSRDCTLFDNTIIMRNGHSIFLYKSNGNSITSNSVTANFNKGIYLDHSHENIIENNRIAFSGTGIHLDSSNLNTISNNNVSDVDYYMHPTGISLFNSSENNISENYLKNNTYGIQLQDAMENSVRNNIVLNGRYGINLEQSDRNEILGNNVSNVEWAGLAVEISNDNSIVGNSISNSQSEGIRIWESNRTIISENIIYSNEFNGITLYWSNWNNITANQVFSNENGLGILYSSNIIISNNNFDGNRRDGIYLINSTINNIESNQISNNKVVGLNLIVGSNQNTILRNTISSNACGFILDNSTENIIHHNHFTDNIFQLNQTEERINIWDDGEEGNYWSDYEGYDTNGDGIGDTDLPHNGVDRYPITDRGGFIFLNILLLFFIIALVAVFLIFYIWSKKKNKKEDEQKEKEQLEEHDEESSIQEEVVKDE